MRQGAILRLRPIMMTALVAALGLLPAALATGRSRLADIFPCVLATRAAMTSLTAS